jgi:hypothetical protein
MLIRSSPKKYNQTANDITFPQILELGVFKEQSFA